MYGFELSTIEIFDGQLNGVKRAVSKDAEKKNQIKSNLQINLLSNARYIHFTYHTSYYRVNPVSKPNLTGQSG